MPPDPSPFAHAADERWRAQRYGVLLFCSAFALRLAALLVFRWYEEAGGKLPWTWGFESANVARSIAIGDGFANPWIRTGAPFDQQTGATGWLSPAYPLLLAGLMRSFGSVTLGTAAALFALQSVLSALTAVLVWRLGVLAGHARAGRVAGWIFALHPYAVWNAAHTVWDTTLCAFALSGFAWLALHAGRSSSRARWALLGAAYGVLLLVLASALAGVPLLAWWLARGARGWGERFARWGAFAAAALLCCGPWLVRNARELGSPSLRTNLGVELAVGNFDGARGYFSHERHPSYSASEFERYRELGEVRYCAQARTRALEWMGAHPLEWAVLTLRRAQIYWLGDPPPLDPRVDDRGRHAAGDARSWAKWLAHLVLGACGLAGLVALARRSAEGALLLGWTLALCVPYCLTHVLERYRFPSEPLLVLGAGALVLALVERRSHALSSAHGS